MHVLSTWMESLSVSVMTATKEMEEFVLVGEQINKRQIVHGIIKSLIVGG